MADSKFGYLKYTDEEKEEDSVTSTSQPIVG